MLSVKYKFRLNFALLLLSLFIVTTTATAQSNLKQWETFNYAKQKVAARDAQKLELDDLQRVRGIVFGKHGRVFKEKTIQNFLKTRAWYKPNPKFQNAALNQTERQNLDVIRLTEAAKHDFVQPGDLRYWQKKAIPADKISAQTSAEWRIMIAEIGAIRGQTFADEPWLQQYFDERYWYKPNPNFAPSLLTDVEKANIAALEKARAESRSAAVSPGDMDKFQTALLTEDLLEKVSIKDLREMQNEFFARHGKKFKAPQIQAQFEFQEWYRVAKDQSKIKLTGIEQQNVDLLAKIENRKREALTTTAIAEDDLSGMFTEDLRFLRNEIYARHGRIFKTKDLNDYFTQQTWYKPDPNYADSVLTATEYANLTTIKKVEADAVSKFSAVEG